MWKDKLKSLKETEGVVFKEQANNQTPTKENLEKLQNLFNRDFPKVLVDFLKEINGFSFEGPDHISYQFFSAAQMWHASSDYAVDFDNFEENLEELVIDKGLKRLCWNDGGWIPLAESSTGQIHFLDIDPAKGGTKGQIGSFHAGDVQIKIVGKTFDAWFSSFVEDYLKSQKNHLEKQKQQPPEKKEKKPWWKL